MNKKVRIKNLKGLIEEHRKEKVIYRTYEFDNDSYMALLCDINSLLHQLEEKEEYINIMSEAFDELKMQKQDYTQINILEMKLKAKDKVIDELYKYLDNFDTQRLEEQGLGVEVKEFIIKPLEILERGKNEQR